MSIRSGTLRTFIRQNKLVNYAPIIVRGLHNERQGDREHRYNNYKKYSEVTTMALLGSVLIGSAMTEQIENKNKRNDCKEVEAGKKRPDLPTYRAEEVSKHNTIDNFWVTYKEGVYDVTKFLPSHPGGEQILNAGGLSIEPFWNVYGMHNTTEVHALLEKYRIGNLHSDDIVDHSDESMWAQEPARDARLRVKTRRPFNAETPPEHLVASLDTPNELFYVRQHMPVPECEAQTHSVCVVTGAVRRRFSLTDLNRFPIVTMRATLMCAGNRRTDMNKVKQVKGIAWTTGAIGTAVWTGVLLRDVLLQCGVDESDVEGKHVILEGADIDATGVKFSTSIPLHQALDRNARVLLATHMNGEPLPPDHGAPLRAVVPGAPAVRSVKWLDTIRVSTEESESHWHRKDYRSFNPSVTWETADFERAPPLYSLPVTSAICVPGDGDTVPVTAGHIRVEGYAYSGGGAAILRVDVSCDGGASWREARPAARDAAPPRAHYAWTLWQADVPVRSGQTEVEIWVKATDTNLNTQPENFEHIWNIRGLLSNAYHKIKVQLQH
ncbi:sulfite oxidase, mitochondrial [Pectinophora gossypiella]|uniref:sulfite oxidase, mitochondrial n=1 Tax=Pectinophora gossypiella TaxID=13191 RepID=UPI00214F5BAB|nr:sulfite oxidase, mitochondrial [Pectinophora gossypiella]